MEIEMKQKLSVCGCDCSACEHFKNSKCSGCSKIEGKVWWTSYISVDICPIYNCVINENKLENCGLCSEIPCKLWRDLKDPSYTDEQHETSINERVENLRKFKTL